MDNSLMTGNQIRLDQGIVSTATKKHASEVPALRLEEQLSSESGRFRTHTRQNSLMSDRDGSSSPRAPKSSRKDKFQRKYERYLLQDIVEQMIDELTTVGAYEVYVNSNIKKDMAKTSNKIVKDVVKKMTLEVALDAIADETMTSVLSATRVTEKTPEIADIVKTPSTDNQHAF